jgi:putative ABC transport system ATP-binding protein
VSLEFDNVVKHYAADGGEIVHAVNGVTLSIEGGEMVALYGPSGSGKTTLLMLAAALMRPDQGRVRFAGRDLSGLGENEAADYRLRDVGVVFQHYELMRGVPAVENAAIKLLSEPISIAEARRRAAPWLERVGLGHRLEAMPEQLSGGERQRVAIARALANDPRLILADEPTGSLDTQRGLEILMLLRDIAHERGVPVLVVTHDPQAAQIADRVHTLRDGRLDAVSKDVPPAAPEPAPTAGI